MYGPIRGLGTHLIKSFLYIYFFGGNNSYIKGPSGMVKEKHGIGSLVVYDSVKAYRKYGFFWLSMASLPTLRIHSLCRKSIKLSDINHLLMSGK